MIQLPQLARRLERVKVNHGVGLHLLETVRRDDLLPACLNPVEDEHHVLVTPKQEGAHVLVPSLGVVVPVEVFLNAGQLQVELELTTHTSETVDLVLLCALLAKRPARVEGVVSTSFSSSRKPRSMVLWCRV